MNEKDNILEASKDSLPEPQVASVEHSSSCLNDPSSTASSRGYKIYEYVGECKYLRRTNIMDYRGKVSEFIQRLIEGLIRVLTTTNKRLARVNHGAYIDRTVFTEQINSAGMSGEAVALLTAGLIKNTLLHGKPDDEQLSHIFVNQISEANPDLFELEIITATKDTRYF